ncbi:MAG TPA: toll/interleukin-1 receptor domain-containing protein [Saprospiraceae bacterium]|nr:toll/interleukin-1 receptor domain-containing protein [Saprospiraceae bacterium]
MRLTTKSLHASYLGFDLQLLNWGPFKDSFQERLKNIRSNLQEIEFDINIPDTFEEFDSLRIEIIDKIIQYLKNERSKLGGEIFGYTFFYYGYIPFELIASAAWKSENYEPLLVNLMLMLSDLEIEVEYESIKKIIDLETKWLTEQASNQEGNINADDVLKSSIRLQSKIGSLMVLADKFGQVKFDQPPFYSVFISYSTKDEEFCQSLYTALNTAGIRVWFAPQDIRGGKKIEIQIHQAIEQYDKLLLVISDSSMKSGWIETELLKARERELQEGNQLLFPIRLIPIEAIKNWKVFDADTGKDLAREVREYFIPDFSDWSNKITFENEVKRLIEALVMEESKHDQHIN